MLITTKNKALTISLAAIVIIATALRFSNINAQPLWLDEAYSYWFSSQSLSDLWTFIPQYESHPSLYYTLLKLWRGLFGDSETSLRSLSAVFSILTVPLVYLTGRNLGGLKAGPLIGFISAALFATSPLHLQYAQEARPYAMLSFSVALSLAGLSWLLRCARDDLKETENTSGQLPYGWPLYGSTLFVIGTALALWSHNLGGLYVLSVGLFWLYWIAASRDQQRTRIIKLAVLWMLVIILFSPHIYFLLNQISNVSSGFWIKAPGLVNVVATTKSLLTIGYFRHFDPFYFLVPLSLFGIWSGWSKGHNLAIILLLSTIAIALLIDLIVSYAITPIFLKRTLIWISLPFTILIAFGIAALPGKALKFIAFVALLSISLKGVLNYFESHRKEPWPSIVEATQHHNAKSLVVIAPNSIELPYHYYLKKRNEDYDEEDIIVLPDSFPTWGLDRPYIGKLVPLIIESDLDIVRVKAQQYSNIWFISRRMDIFDPMDNIGSTIRNNGFVELESRKWGGISALRFSRTDNYVNPGR